jgi:hypothetical protein
MVEWKKRRKDLLKTVCRPPLSFFCMLPWKKVPLEQYAWSECASKALRMKAYF